ncbi:MAG: hypothetical protein P4L72_00045 [Parvibaculum sp.]|uniref:hypothetical protein n=1 Tax=Parvibaculum sp. TaxID=2024848 RepID=UPI002849F6DB|nr:hypothetical protein [Parvibaculum sp.]MDR3497596.1 hypothetical protein [Parvibaculum sp.]
MPTSPKILLIAIAVIEGLVGLFMVIAPAAVAAKAMPGVDPGLAGIVMARTAGTALISLGALAWLARNTTERVALQPNLGALLVYNVLAVVNLLWQASNVTTGAIAPAIVHLILGAALFVYWRRMV